jgi:hypothetical protein
MPSPVSLMAIVTSEPLREARTLTMPPDGVKRMALVSRLRSTCWRRRASPLTVAAIVVQSRPMPLRSTSGRMA